MKNQPKLASLSPVFRGLLLGGMALLVAGCGTIPFTKAKGVRGALRYDRDACPLKDSARVAVFFDPCRPLRQRPTRWRVVTVDGPRRWYPVTARPVFRVQPPDVYGIQFQICDPKSVDEPPPSGTITLLEKQRLFVPIYYR